MGRLGWQRAGEVAAERHRAKGKGVKVVVWREANDGGAEEFAD